MTEGIAKRKIEIHKLSNYGFALKEALNEEDSTSESRLNKIREDFSKKGTRKSIEVVMLVYERGHAHVLALQSGSFYKLPGDKLEDDEDVRTAINRILDKYVQQAPVDHGEECQVDELLGTWFRPNFDHHLYPYCPPHVKGSAKEEINLYLFTLPKHKMFTIPKNYKVVAIPLYELYENQQKYGQVLSDLPYMLSRYEFTANE